MYVRLQSFHDNIELIMNSFCMSFCKASTPSTYQWLFYRASKSSIIINVLVALRQVVGLMQFIIFRHIFVWKGFLLLMSWEPSASLGFPVETSTASFSRCSRILLAGSEIGKSESIKLSGVASSNCIISSLKIMIREIVGMNIVQSWLIY